MYYKKDYNLFNGVYFNQVFRERRVLAKFISIILKSEVDEFDIEYLDNSVFNLGSKGIYDIYFNIRKKEFIRLTLETMDYSRDYMGSKLRYFNSQLISQVHTDYGYSKDYSIKSICITNSLYDHSDRLIDCYHYYDVENKQAFLPNIFDIRVINLNNISKCKNLELKELLELFVYDYDKLSNLEFKTKAAKYSFNLIKYYNESNELVNKKAYTLEREEHLEGRLLYDLNKINKILNDMIITMFNNKYDIETISKVSNLEEDEILEIINKK